MRLMCLHVGKFLAPTLDARGDSRQLMLPRIDTRWASGLHTYAHIRVLATDDDHGESLTTI